ASGASVRNFGMLWPIGQPAGPRRDLALRSLAIWLDVLRDSGLWHERAGSLHLAYHEDEAQVLREVASGAGEGDFPCALLGSRGTLVRYPSIRAEGLRAALWSPSETCVDPRQVVAGLPAWLAEQHGVRFEFGRAVLGFDRPRVRTSGGDRQADHLWVCS